MVLIRLVPRDDHPEDRQDFVHPDLQGHVRAVRRDVLGALIGMVENWKAAGAPLHPKPMGGFEHWAGMVGGILAHHGFTDWRGNEKAFRREADPEGADLSALVEAWADKWPDTKVRTTELLELCRELGVFGRVFMTKNDTGAALSLSKTVLRAYQDRPVGTWCIRSSGSGSNSLYFLEWAA
jgi:hypothetical protein